MADPSDQSSTTEADDKSSLIHYETRGARDAITFYAGSKLIQYKVKARLVCYEHTKESEKEKQKKVDNLQKTIDEKARLIAEREQEIERKEIESKNYQEELERVEIDKDIVNLSISGSIVIVLGAALFLFYILTLSGVIGALLGSNDEQLLGSQSQITVPNLWDKFLFLPLYLKVISILIAVLPLGIGYLLQGYKHKKRWGSFYSLLASVFVLDMLIAFVVEQQIYNQESLITELPSFAQYIKDHILGTFGAIIILGFGAYVVWGILLESFFEHLSPQATRAKMERKAKRLSAEMADLKTQVKALEADIDGTRDRIRKVQDSKTIDIDDIAKKELEKNLSDYTAGWQKLIDIYHGYDSSTKEDRIMQLHELRQEVLKEFYSALDKTD